MEERLYLLDLNKENKECMAEKEEHELDLHEE